MGNRSYLMVRNDSDWIAILEGNNCVPLAWVALLSEEALHSDASEEATPTLRLAEGPSHGVSLSLESALDRLGARRERIETWLGVEAAQVFAQFAEYLRESASDRLHIDLSEWFDLSNSSEEAWETLRQSIAVLDLGVQRGAKPKSIPRAANALLKEYGLKGMAPTEPAFGNLLAGSACSGQEPWRRLPPRAIRSQDDREYWSGTSGSHCVSRNGMIAIALADNQAGLSTPICRLPNGMFSRLQIDDSISRLFLHSMSNDGTVLFGTYEPDYDIKQVGFRHSPQGFETLLVENRYPFVATSCSGDASTATGWYSTTDAIDFDQIRAALWRDGVGVPIAHIGTGRSEACLASNNGEIVVGHHQAADGTVHAFSWSTTAGLSDLGVALRYIHWFALSPDGRAGMFRGKYHGDTDELTFHWIDGRGVISIADNDGSPLVGHFHASVNANAAVAICPGSNKDAWIAMVWRCGCGLECIPLHDTWVRPHVLAVGPDAEWFCWQAQRDFPTSVFICELGSGVREYPLRNDNPDDILFARAASAPARWPDIVLMVDPIRNRTPLRWTPKNIDTIPSSPADVR